MEKTLVKVEDAEAQDLKKVSTFQKIGINLSVLEYRTPFDKSEYPCVENILRGAIKSFVVAYGVKAFLTMLMSLLKYRKIMKDPMLLIQPFLSKDSVKIGCFLGSNTLIMKTVVTLTRILRKKDDGLNGFLAGLAAGYLSLFFFKNGNRLFLTCFLLSRAFDCCYNHLVNKGTIKKSPYHYTIIFSLMNALTGWAYAHEPYLLNPAMEKFGDKMTSQGANENILGYLRKEMTRRALMKRGIIKEPYLL